MAVEVRSTDPQSLPPGNVWEFSERNRWLRPSLYRQEFKADLSPEKQELVAGVQSAYIASGWKFASVMGNDKSLAVVFVNPDRIDTKPSRPEPDFLPDSDYLSYYLDEIVKPSGWGLNKGAVNKLLEGTNLYAYDVRGGYNRFEVTRKEGFLVKKPRNRDYFQSGVAYVYASLQTLDDQIANVDEDARNLTLAYMNRFAEFQAEIIKLRSTASAEPKQLFPPFLP